MGRAKYTVFILTTGTPLPRPVLARLDSFAGHFPTVIRGVTSRDIATQRKTVRRIYGMAECTGFSGRRPWFDTAPEADPTRVGSAHRSRSCSPAIQR